MGLWVAALNKLLLRLPQDVQDAVTKHEANGTYDSKEYRDAVAVFYAHFVCRLDPYPEDLMKSLANIEKDPTVYNTMCVTLKVQHILTDSHPQVRAGRV